MSGKASDSSILVKTSLVPAAQELANWVLREAHSAIGTLDPAGRCASPATPVLKMTPMSHDPRVGDELLKKTLSKDLDT